MLIFRSALFLLWFSVSTLTLSLLYLPLLLLPSSYMQRAAKFWCRVTLFGLHSMAGQDCVWRGEKPVTPLLVASKHMSMWDTLALYVLLDCPAIIFKRELVRVPFYGWYVKKAGMIGIDRSGKASALRKMSAEAKAALALGRHVLIFPEGTRKKPDAPPDYKIGVAGLYSQLGVACLPIALNSGLYWTGPGGFLKKPGQVVAEAMPLIPAGLQRNQFMEDLQALIEQGTQQLVQEAREAGA